MSISLASIMTGATGSLALNLVTEEDFQILQESYPPVPGQEAGSTAWGPIAQPPILLIKVLEPAVNSSLRAVYWGDLVLLQIGWIWASEDLVDE